MNTNLFNFRIALFVVLLNSAFGCRMRDSQQPLLSADSSGTNPAWIDDRFDWFGAEVEGKQQPTRDLEFCFDPGLRAQIRSSVILAAEKINAANTGWSLTLRNKLAPEHKNPEQAHECDSTWKMSVQTLGTQEHLRIREDSKMLPSSDDISTFTEILIDSVSAQPIQTNQDEKKRTLRVEDVRAADFLIRKSFTHNFIIAGEIVFNGKASMKWQNSDDTLQVVDPDVVALHMIGHALRLKDNTVEDSDIQVESCGNKYAPGADSKPKIGIAAGPNTKILATAIGDDIATESDINVGPDQRLDSHKTRTVMHPVYRMGNHCLNPSGATGKEDRINLSKADIELLKLSAGVAQ